MDLKNLEKAAKLLGFRLSWYGNEAYPYYERPIDRDFAEPFNPHEESGAHWNKKILKKFIPSQWEKYDDLMEVIWDSDVDVRENIDYLQWLVTASEEIKFKCIMEVIK